MLRRFFAPPRRRKRHGVPTSQTLECRIIPSAVTLKTDLAFKSNADGSPQKVTIDPGAILKLQDANIDAG